MVLQRLVGWHFTTTLVEKQQGTQRKMYTQQHFWHLTAFTEFYCDVEYSRQMPGSKDYVSIGRNVHMQKRLLLCDLKEIYAAFKQEHPDKI